MDLNNAFIANFRSSFLKIKRNGLNTLITLSTLILENYDDEFGSKLSDENTMTTKSSILAGCHKYDSRPLIMNPVLMILSAASNMNMTVMMISMTMNSILMAGVNGSSNASNMLENTITNRMK